MEILQEAEVFEKPKWVTCNSDRVAASRDKTTCIRNIQNL
jgi:hypothetical protein